MPQFNIPNSNQQISSDGSVDSIWFRFFNNLAKRVNSTRDFFGGGFLKKNFSIVTNAADTALNTLQQIVIDQNTLKNIGDSVVIESSGTLIASSSNTKNIYLRIGGDLLNNATITGASATDGAWQLKTKITKIGATSIYTDSFNCHYWNGAGATKNEFFSGTFTTSESLTVEVLAQESVAYASVRVYSTIINLYPAG